MTLYEWSFHLPCTMNDVTAVEVDVVATQESPGGGSCSASSFLELTSEGGVLVPRGATETYAPVGDSIELLIENAITAPSPVGVGEGKSSQSTGSSRVPRTSTTFTEVPLPPACSQEN